MKDHGLSKEEIRAAENLDGVPDREPKTRLTFAGKIRGIDIAIEGTGEEVIKLIYSVVDFHRLDRNSGPAKYEGLR